MADSACLTKFDNLDSRLDDIEKVIVRFDTQYKADIGNGKDGIIKRDLAEVKTDIKEIKAILGRRTNDTLRIVIDILKWLIGPAGIIVYLQFFN